MKKILFISLIISLCTSVWADQKPRIVISTKGGSISFKNHIRGISFFEIITGCRQNLHRKGFRYSSGKKSSSFKYIRRYDSDTSKILVAKGQDISDQIQGVLIAK